MQMKQEVFMCSKLYGWEYTWPEYVQLADLFFDDISEDLFGIECQSSEPMLMGQYEELLAIGDPELHENVGEVMPHRNIANVKALSDFLIFQSTSDKSYDAPLPLGQALSFCIMGLRILSTVHLVNRSHIGFYLS